MTNITLNVAREAIRLVEAYRKGEFQLVTADVAWDVHGLDSPDGLPVQVLDGAYYDENMKSVVFTDTETCYAFAVHVKDETIEQM